MSSSAEHDRTLSDNACACTGKNSKHFNESSQGNLDDIFFAFFMPRKHRGHLKSMRALNGLYKPHIEPRG